MGSRTDSSKQNAFRRDPGRIVQVKITESVQLQSVMALYVQEVARNDGTPIYQQFKKLKLNFIMIRWWEIEISESETMLWNEDQLPRVKRKQSPRWGASGRVFSVESTWTMSKGDSCSFSRDPLASGSKGKGQRRKERSSSPASHSKSKQTDGEGRKSPQGSGKKQENSRDKNEIPCRFKFCTNPSCRFWHPPVCVNYKSEKGCTHGDKCHFLHVDAEESPTKSQRKVVREDQLRYWRSLHNWVVYLKILIRGNLFYVNLENWDLNTPSNSPKAPGTKSKFGKERVHREVFIQKCAPHERSLCAPKFEDRSHEETLHQERRARKASWDLAKNIYKLKNSDKARFKIPGEAKVMSTPITSKKKNRRARIRSWFRSINAHVWLARKN